MTENSDSLRRFRFAAVQAHAGLSARIRAQALRLGFDHCRIVPVEAARHADFYELWLRAGRAGEMTYLERYTEKRRHPGLLTPQDAEEYRSILVLGVNYFQFQLPERVRRDPSRGVIASYAWSDDYHDIIRRALYEIDGFVRSMTGRSTPGKCLVDTGPVLERDWAQRAGLGFTGKNCCTIHPVDGSWLLLATVMVPERLAYDTEPGAVADRHSGEPAPREVADGLPRDQIYGAWEIPAQAAAGGEQPATHIGTCGRCTRCLDACPTDAFVGPFHLDPQRCISYWTIEARQPIPVGLRPLFGNRIFGCDICQEVCPWNRRLPARTPIMAGLRAQEDRVAPPLLEGFRAESPYWLDREAFEQRFRRSPVLRAQRHGMLRNVCVALGNWADVDTLPALSRAILDPEPLARGHAAWALGCVAARHGSGEPVHMLEEAWAREPVEWVRKEMQQALA